MKCTECSDFTRRLRQTQPKLSEEEKKVVRDERKVHLDRVLAERLSWHNRMQECRDSLNEDVMAIYLDGMDQEKTWIPKLSYKEQDKKADKVLKCR